MGEDLKWLVNDALLAILSYAFAPYSPMPGLFYVGAVLSSLACIGRLVTICLSKYEHRRR